MLEASEGDKRADQQRRAEATVLRAEEVAHCELCDDDGYRNGVPCDHVDRSETAERGMAKVRAAMAKGTKP